MSNIAVTPLVGVWIEMSVSYRPYILKLVTPLVGVWIEIHNQILLDAPREVTPLVGVWIEIVVFSDCIAAACRHSPRGSVD